jgi:hypothetical protein
MGYADVVAKTGEAAKSGPIGLAVILVLCVACYFLFKSMSKHLKTVREDFPADQPPPADAPGQADASAQPGADAPRANIASEPPPAAQP